MKSLLRKVIIGGAVVSAGVSMPAVTSVAMQSETERKIIKATVNPDDVKSIDSIIKALYEVVSGAKGEKLNWGRMKGLFIEGGKLQPTGNGGMRNWTVEDYANIAGANLENVDFFETENSRIVETYGAITHVWSTYESRRAPSDKEPFMRGINSIQLMFDGKRWWIVSVFWQGETKDLPLPSKYVK